MTTAIASLFSKKAANRSLETGIHNKNSATSPKSNFNNLSNFTGTHEVVDKRSIHFSEFQEAPSPLRKGLSILNLQSPRLNSELRIKKPEDFAITLQRVNANPSTMQPKEINGSGHDSMRVSSPSSQLHLTKPQMKGTKSGVTTQDPSPAQSGLMRPQIWSRKSSAPTIGLSDSKTERSVSLRTPMNEYVKPKYKSPAKLEEELEKKPVDAHYQDREAVESLDQWNNEYKQSLCNSLSCFESHNLPEKI